MEQPTQLFKPGTPLVERTCLWEVHIQAHVKLEGLYIYDFWHNPCYHEVLSARAYPAELALAEVEDLRFLLFRFGKLTWADQCFANITLPPVPLLGDVLPLYMVAICAEDGIIRVSIPGIIDGDFLDHLKLFVARQRRVRMDDEELQRRVTKLFHRCPTPEHLLPFVVARTTIAQPPPLPSTSDVIETDVAIA